MRTRNRDSELNHEQNFDVYSMKPRMDLKDSSHKAFTKENTKDFKI